jgi:endogenous inhibitor of DNA gyrase (YacG/DUF329 family)
MSTDHPTGDSVHAQHVPSLPGRKVVTCEHCGVLMELRRAATRRFCSKRCSIGHRHGKPKPQPATSRVVDRALAQSNLAISVCQWCGDDFIHAARLNRLFCSHSCSSKHKAKARKDAGLPKVCGRKPSGSTRPCEVCGTPIYVKQWQEKKGQGRFCGRACKDQWWARNARTVACEWCGKEIKVRPSVPTRRFCSRSCLVEGRRTRAIDRLHNGRRAHVTKQGYVYLWEPDHPKSGTYNGWYAEHRLVLEQKLGRVLETEEQVHHCDGCKSNNHPDNLMLVSASEHQAFTRDEIVARRRANQAELEAYRQKFGPLS